MLIRSPDTDVAVIGLCVVQQLPCQLLLDCGSGKHHRVISLTDAAVRLG